MTIPIHIAQKDASIKDSISEGVALEKTKEYFSMVDCIIEGNEHTNLLVLKILIVNNKYS